jgi:hypothetical protein
MRGVKRERIIRVLLGSPGGDLTKYRVAKLSGTSIAWTMEYLKSIEEAKLVKATRVVSKEKLLDLWFSISRAPKHFDFFVQSPGEFLSGAGLEYALTTYAAENLLNHYLFPTRTDLYIREADLPLWKERMKGNALAGKGNLRLLVYDEHAMFGKKNIGGMWVASVPQVLIDLRREGGVCLEAYEMMVEKYVR